MNHKDEFQLDANLLRKSAARSLVGSRQGLWVRFHADNERFARFEGILTIAAWRALQMRLRTMSGASGGLCMASILGARKSADRRSQPFGRLVSIARASWMTMLSRLVMPATEAKASIAGFEVGKVILDGSFKTSSIRNEGVKSNETDPLRIACASFAVGARIPFSSKVRTQPGVHHLRFNIR